MQPFTIIIIIVIKVTIAWLVRGCCSARAGLMVTNWYMIVYDFGEGAYKCPW